MPESRVVGIRCPDCGRPQSRHTRADLELCLFWHTSEPREGRGVASPHDVPMTMHAAALERYIVTGGAQRRALEFQRRNHPGYYRHYLLTRHRGGTPVIDLPALMAGRVEARSA